MPMNKMGFQNGIAFDKWGSVIIRNITYDRHNPPWPDSDDGTRYDVWYEYRDKGTAHRSQYCNLPRWQAIGICNSMRLQTEQRLWIDTWIERTE